MRENDHTSRTVMITGASRGIGFALAAAYLAEDWQVVGTCRDPNRSNQLATLAEHHANLTICKLDVTDARCVERAAKEMNGAPIDVLINNAGVYHRTADLSHFNEEEWRHTFDTNLFGALRTLIAFLPAVRAGRGKKIVSISSWLGSISQSDGGSYSYRSSKAALNMAMRSIAADLSDEEIIVSLISPGLVDTDLARDVPRAKISPAESARGLLQLIDDLRPADSGQFLRYNREELAW